jgi:hypothetical protein
VYESLQYKPLANKRNVENNKKIFILQNMTFNIQVNNAFNIPSLDKFAML